ncbi:isoform 4 of kinesin light chain [Aspergillus udagawae]|uniref:Isoform 4 of kinesin light chain n=1 Tax=Aspergillus udagawae TaxID=91492 RepID=A0A8H3N0T1_9EURO|nr:isoform 4 of kinesin light chain [Aspergillus udagawae]
MALMHDDYSVAWICALPLEMAAASVMLDKTHKPLPKPSTDPNAYVLGELKGNYIVIACLPDGIYGTISASKVMAHMVSTFPRVQFGLMVGIGGGVPSTSNDIRLGDVVVSKPVGRYSGVIQYDYGKAVQGGQFERTGTLNKPPQTLLTHVAHLESQQMIRREDAISTIVQDVLNRNPDMKDRFSPPNQQSDYLFRSSYRHADPKSNCEKCDKGQLVCRPPRTTNTPHIHYGLIASGDQVMKDSETRDRLAQQHGILCFEMEAAGLMDGLPTLVIRGICDYCDSHKQKEWQAYAALAAAAYAKWLLSAMTVSRMNQGLTKNNSRMGHYIVPLGRNPRFVGRQNEITRLEELITMKDGPRKVAVTGLGGVGKTQVALELAYRVRDRDKECSIFWVACTSYEVIEQTYLNMAQALGLPNVKPAEVKEQVKRYLISEQAGQWLLIFDNADDVDMWLSDDRACPALEDFLPQSEQGRILLTTRNRKLAVELTSSNIIPIPHVDEDTALKILERSLVDKGLLQDHPTAVAILEKLSFLPLAITQASAYINKNGLDLSTYSTLLQEQEPEVVELLSEDFKDEGRYKDLQNPVITTWLISFKQIQCQDQLAAEFLSFMACINPRNIPRSLLPMPASRKRGIDALGLLNAYAFINSQDTGINLHRLVHIAMRNWLRQNALFSHWIQRAADQMRNVFPDDHCTNRGLWREYLPHALSLVYEDEFTAQWKVYVDLIENIANCLYEDGKFHEAEVLYTELLRIKQEETEPNHPSALYSMARLIVTYRKQGRLKEAERLGVQVLGMMKTVVGAEHPDTLISMSNLALVYASQGRWKEAEKLGVQVLETAKTVLGAEHPDTLTNMSNLAAFYSDQGRWKEAENLGVQVLETEKTMLGAEHPDTLTSMSNLALVYWKQGRWKEAEKLGVQVMEMRKTVLGARHPDTLTCMSNLALVYASQGRWKEAEKLGVQVMEMRKTVLGARHPDTLTCMSNLALVYASQGRWKEAEKLGVQVMEMRKTVLGARHPDTLISMHKLAYTWKSQEKLQDALALMEQCSELCNKTLGPNHPVAISSSRSLSDWKGIHDSLASERTPTAGSQIEGSQHPETATEHTVAALIAQQPYEERVKAPHVPIRSTARLFLGDHPLLMAFRSISAERGGQELQEID